MHIDYSKSNDFHQKKSKEGRTRRQIKDKGKAGKRMETQLPNKLLH